MQRRIFRPLLILGLWLISGLPLLSQAPDVPNVVIFYIDDMDFDEIGHYKPHPPVLTPNIDTLIANSVEFTNGYVTSAVCTPSRFSLLSGLYASRSTELRAFFPDEDLASVRWNSRLTSEENAVNGLRENGIRSGVVGKWHLGTDSEFDLHRYEKGKKPNAPNVSRMLQEDYARTQSDIKAIGFDEAEALYLKNLTYHDLPELHFHNVEWITGHGLQFIDQSIAKNNPFFLLYSSTIPHGPPPFLSLRNNDYVTPLGILDESEILPSDMVSREEIRRRGKNYRKEHLTWLDDGIGAVIRKLKAQGIYDETLIFFISDHQSRGKYANYEGGHVPFAVKPPYWDQKHVKRSELVANIDVMPTIYALTGTAATNRKFDGQNLAPLWKEEATDHWRTHLMTEIGYSKAIVAESGEKLIRRKFPKALLDSAQAQNSLLTNEGVFYTGKEVRYEVDVDFPNYFDHDQYYDLNTDPLEQTNIYKNEVYAVGVHNLNNVLKVELSKLPHNYSAFLDEISSLNTAHSNATNLKVIEVVDSVAFLRQDTLQLESADTLTLRFLSLHGEAPAVSPANRQIPDWLVPIDSTFNEQEKKWTFQVDRQQSDINDRELKLSFMIGDQTLTYRAITSPSVILSTGTNTLPKSPDIRVYPNPTDDTLHFETNRLYEVRLFNTLGKRELARQDGNRIMLSGLKPGLYILQFWDSDRLVHTESIIKK